MDIYLCLSLSPSALRYCLFRHSSLCKVRGYSVNLIHMMQLETKATLWIIVTGQPGNLLVEGFIFKTLIIIKNSVFKHIPQRPKRKKKTHHKTNVKRKLKHI